MTAILRVLVNDQDSTQYTDDSLGNVLVVGAFQVLQEVSFVQSYTVKVSQVSIVPDPTAALTLDESFTNLVCLKSAAITDKGAAIIAANRAIAVRDGSSSVDLRGILQGKLALLKAGVGAKPTKMQSCNIFRIPSRLPAAIMTPFRLFALGDWGRRRVTGGIVP